MLTNISAHEDRVVMVQLEQTFRFPKANRSNEYLPICDTTIIYGIKDLVCTYVVDIIKS